MAPISGVIPSIGPSVFLCNVGAVLKKASIGEVLMRRAVRRWFCYRVAEAQNCTTMPISILLERFDCVVTACFISGSPRGDL